LGCSFCEDRLSVRGSGTILYSSTKIWGLLVVLPVMKRCDVAFSSPSVRALALPSVRRLTKNEKSAKNAVSGAVTTLSVKDYC